MKKFLLAAAFLAMISSEISWSSNIKNLFVQMPDSILPLLTVNDRMDFLDYMESGMTPKANNKLGGESVLTLMTDDHLSVKVTDDSRFDLIMLEKKDGSSLLCVINTVMPQYADSRIRFFDENWNSIDGSGLLERPTLGDFMTKEALKSDSLEVLFDQSLLRLSTAEYRDGFLVFCYTSLDYIGDDADRFRSFFRESLEYKWNGKRFKRVGK